MVNEKGITWLYKTRTMSIQRHQGKFFTVGESSQAIKHQTGRGSRSGFVKLFFWQAIQWYDPFRPVQVWETSRCADRLAFAKIKQPTTETPWFTVASSNRFQKGAEHDALSKKIKINRRGGEEGGEGGSKA